MSVVQAGPGPEHAGQDVDAARAAQAALREQIASGERSAIAVLLDPPLPALTWAVGDLLEGQPGWSSPKSRRILFRSHVHERKCIGALSPGQRQAIVNELERAARP
jgi:hypothetical protein